MDKEKFDYLFKIVLVGDTNVGKTNILSWLKTNDRPAVSKPTIGVEFGTKTFRFDDAVVKAQIWDTAGQERYHAITAAYYRGSCGAVIVYDISSKNSLENATSVWLKNLKSAADPDIPVMLLGNKRDLERERALEEEAGRAVALKNGMGFFETSAVSGENIQKAFETFIRQIYNAEKQKKDSPTRVKIRKEDLAGHEVKMSSKHKKSSCC